MLELQHRRRQLWGVSAEHLRSEFEDLLLLSLVWLSGAELSCALIVVFSPDRIAFDGHDMLIFILLRRE